VKDNIILTTPGDLAKVKIVEGVIKNRGIILDLGCGAGLSIGSLSKFGVVIGLDLSKQKLRKANEIYKHVDFILGDAQYLPFKDGTFNVIVAKDVLEHIVDDKRVVNEAYRVSKNHAEFVAIVPISYEEACFSIEATLFRLIGYSIDTQVSHVRRYTVHTVIAMLRKCGFRAVEISYFAHVASSLFAVLLIAGYEIFKKKEGVICSSRFSAYFIEVILKLLEPLCLLEYKIFRKLPGAGLIVYTLKIPK
jgi:ubiquinone/menaquinone biosynthesis C-methylase UbiE